MRHKAGSCNQKLLTNNAVFSSFHSGMPYIDDESHIDPDICEEYINKELNEELVHTKFLPRSYFEWLLYKTHFKFEYQSWSIHFISFHFKFLIHGSPINQGWLLFRGPWKKLNYNVTKNKRKKNKKNAKLD